MLNPVLDHLSTESLLQKKRFSTIALITVWLAAAFAIGAALFVWTRDGVLPEMPLYMGIISFMVSFPVYSEKKRIIELLKTRNI